MTISIEKELFQWDKNRVVNILLEEGDIAPTHLQFYNKKSSRGLEFNFEEKAKIPNSLLKEKTPIVVLACHKGDKEEKVLCRREFKVLARPKPDSYIDDEEGIEIIYDGGVEV